MGRINPENNTLEIVKQIPIQNPELLFSVFRLFLRRFLKNLKVLLNDKN
jgi:hypothetical protein